MMIECNVCKGKGFYIGDNGYEVQCSACDGEGTDKED